jgi:hypothetical protein
MAPIRELDELRRHGFDRKRLRMAVWTRLTAGGHS